MTDQPTPEQTPEARFATAHRRLDDAIRAFIAETAEGGQGGVVVDWTLVTATHHELGAGQSATTHGVYATEEAPAYRALGLLAYAEHYVKSALGQATQG